MTDRAGALHREIARRYRGKKKPFLNIRLGEVRKLFRNRLGLDASKEEIQEHISALGKLLYGDPARLGMAMGLTFEERKKHRINTIRCVDKTPREVSEHYAKAREERKKRRKRERRDRQREQRSEQRKAARESHPRVKIMATKLSEEWACAKDLAADVGHLDAFLDKRRRRLDRNALRQAVHRALDALAAAGRLQERIETGPGRIQSRFVRLSDPGRNSRESAHDPVTGEILDDPITRLHEAGPTSDEVAQTIETSRDKETAPSPILTVTEKRPHVSIYRGANFVFPDLPSVLDKRVKR